VIAHVAVVLRKEVGDSRHGAHGLIGSSPS
jgi:hypothetical protein